MVLPEWAVLGPERRAHAERVATLLDRWAAALGVTTDERARWLRAAALHDALKDAPLSVQRRLAGETWRPDAVLHGPAAATMAAECGEQDAGVLDAVRYHSVGYADWDAVGRMLYLADFLEPGRPYITDELRSVAAGVPAAPDAALREVARRRVEYLNRRGVTPHPETLRFWESLR